MEATSILLACLLMTPVSGIPIGTNVMNVTIGDEYMLVRINSTMPPANLTGVYDDFEDGKFLDGSPFLWEVPTKGGYSGVYSMNSVIKHSGSYSVQFGLSSTPVKYGTRITFKNDVWYSGWLYESDNNQDHSMFELFDENTDTAAIIRIYDKGTGADVFKVLGIDDYLTMEGNCHYQEKKWFQTKLRKNGNGLFDAEVWDDSGLLCWKYGFMAQLKSNTATHLRILGDEVVPYTYWDDVGYEVLQ